MSFIHSALGAAQILDAQFYHAEACYLIGANAQAPEDSAVRFANPGYSFALALFYKLFGSAPLGALLVQAVLGGVSVYVLGLSAYALLRERGSAVLAALLWAIFLPAIFYDGMLLIPGLNGFLSILTLYAASRVLSASETQGPRQAALYTLAWALCAGVCSGAASLLRATNSLLLPALIALFRGSRRGASGREFWRLTFALTLGFALVIAPRVLYQRVAAGAWVPISANAGMNLWIGNGESAQGIYHTLAFVRAEGGNSRDFTVINERNGFLHEARRRSGNAELDLVQADAFWRSAAWQRILADIPGWLLLEAKKLHYFWNAYEPRTNTSLAFLEQFSPILKYDIFGFGLYALLGVYGLCTMRSESSRARACLLSLLAAPLATCLLFFVSGEYRFPATPALTVAAAFALGRLGPEARQRLLRTPREARRVWVFGVILAFLVLYPVERQSAIDDFKGYAETLVTPQADGTRPEPENYGLALAVLSKLGNSYAESVIKQEVLLLVYSNQAIQFENIDSARSLVAAATALFQLAPRPAPQLSEYEVVRVYRNQRRRVAQLAAADFMRAYPDVEEQLALLGAHDYMEIKIYLDHNRRSDAQAFIERALSLAPGSAELLAYQGRLEIFKGNMAAGLGTLEKSYNGWPKLALPAVFLSEYSLISGDVAQAKAFFEQARKREPFAPEVKKLAELLARVAAGSNG